MKNPLEKKQPTNFIICHVINLYVYSKKDQRITKLITMNSVVYGGWLIYIPNQQKGAIITLASLERSGMGWCGVKWGCM